MAIRGKKTKRRIFLAAAWIGVVVILAGGTALWLLHIATATRDELQAATSLVPQLKAEVLRGDSEAAEKTVSALQNHTANARTSSSDPIWRLASALPLAGPNFQAVSEISTTADDVARMAAKPLVGVLESLDWKSFTPAKGGVETELLSRASPIISSAANAVQQSSERLDNIDPSLLVPEIAEPLQQSRTELTALREDLQSAADFSVLAPKMLGAEAPRNYLVLIQNNAESRATGGIPGALAVLTVEKGHLTLGSQSSATQLGIFSPPVPVDPDQQQIYSSQLGKYMQDVNLTPDFPSAAKNAQGMWERRTTQRVDGVISIDPIALGYILDATGPVKLNDPTVVAKIGSSLPLELDGTNVVKTLLSDVYARIQKPELQDTYFAEVAKQVFAALSSGTADDKALVDGVAKATAERRISLWSDSAEEQRIIQRYAVGGAISGPSVAPAEFGAYFNDGTGAKMDYYVKRTVQLRKQCPQDGYEQLVLRVTSTNTAPVDAASSLPTYVTGLGSYGIPAGSVQTNIAAYGPSQASIESVTVDGVRAPFAPYFHSDRPVGVYSVRLAPGETKTVDFVFGKIVQHAEPNLVVTPGVQPVKDVILSPQGVSCSSE